tara:strand:+ start:4592 stop:4915 length:324 start_codon:yes stop_codon:yes gene_type:complete
MKIQEAMKRATKRPISVTDNTLWSPSFGRNEEQPHYETLVADTAPDGWEDGPKHRANAALLAHWYNHGPELLEALKDVLKEYNAHWCDDLPSIRAFKLIAKCEEVEL